MKNKILSSIVGFFTLASVLTFTTRASAFSLVHEDGSINDSNKQVVSINDLSFEVDGESKSFDVEFSVGSFNDVFGNTEDVTTLEGDTPTFWNQEDNARNAALAIINALGSEAFTISEANDMTSQLDSFFVPYQANSTNNLELQTFYDAPQTSEDNISTGSVLNLNSALFFPFAKFEESATPVVTPVPEPSSTIAILLLVGSGLLVSRSQEN
jgi:hypothetical protein